MCLPFMVNAQISGVTITPSGATINDSITITVDPALTCPSPTFNSNSSLQGATAMRIHGGAIIGGNNWQNVVEGNVANNVRAGFTLGVDGKWRKKIKPSAYFNSTTMTGMIFVLNGGPNANVWAKEGKVCAPNGSGGSDYSVNFPISGIIAGPGTTPRLGVRFQMPAADTTIDANEEIDVHLFAEDSAFLGVNNVEFYVNGTLQSSDNTAPYNFTYTAPNAAASVTMYAIAYGAQSSSRQSITRTITVREPAAVVPQLSVQITSPGATSVNVGDQIAISANAVDTTGQPITRVVFKRNGSTIGTDFTPPYSLNYTVIDAANFNITADVVGVGAVTRSSSAVNVTVRPVQYGSNGIYVFPANATGNDTITMIVVPTQTCPTPAANSNQSLSGATMVRYHGGVKIGRNGGNWQNGVYTDNSVANANITGFTSVNGVWRKRFVPRTYFNVNAADTITGLSFVLNGGPTGGNIWAKEAKTCGSGGNAASGGAGDIIFPIAVPAFATPQLSVSITSPAAAMTVNVGELLSIETQAADATNQQIFAVVLRLNGVPVDTVRTAPYTFSWRAPADNGVYTLTASVYGVDNNNVTSASRTITVQGQVITPILSATWVTPLTNPTINVNGSVSAVINAADATNQAISVTWLVNGVEVAVDETAPYTYTYYAGQYNGSVSLRARVDGLYGESLLSPLRTITVTGEVPAHYDANGIRITPANAKGTDRITITVDPNATCPTLANNAGQSLANAPVIRMHGGVRIGLNSSNGYFNYVVNAGNSTAETALTGFTRQPNGLWTKSFVPQTYFNRPASDTIVGLGFVLNGGPVNGNQWSRLGKTCGGNGAGDGDFFIDLDYPERLDVIVSGAQSTVAGTTYNDITIGDGGTLTLSDNLPLVGTLRVQSGGRLILGSRVISGMGSIIVEDGATLEIADAGGIPVESNTVTGSFRNSNGRSFSSNADYIFNGTVAQITGQGFPRGARNFTVNNPAGLTLTNNLKVSRMLTVAAGTFSSGGKLTLGSNASGTAMLVNSGGTVSGEVFTQRYVDPTLNSGVGYRHFSFPFSSPSWSTVASSNGGWTQIRNQSYNTDLDPSMTNPYPNIFTFDAQRATDRGSFGAGWQVPNTIEPGKGYAINVSAAAIMQAKGVLNQSNVFAANGVNIPAAGTSQYHLLGNPFPNPLDFNGLAYSGFNNAYYIAQSTGQYAGRFGSFVNGIGTNGATNIIPMMAGFWMQSNVDAPAMGFPNTARVTTYSNPTMQRTATQTLLRLQLTAQTGGNGVTDEAVVYFTEGATNGIDNTLDATSPPSAISLYTSIGGNNFTVNALPPASLEGTNPIVLPLVIRVTGTTPATLAITSNSLPNGAEIALEDTWTGNLIRFNGTNPVALGNGGELDGRYRLVITGNVTSIGAKNDLNINVFPNPAKDVVNVAIPNNGETVKAELINNLGQKVANYTLTESGAINVSNIARGIYSLRCMSNGKTSVFKITLR
jgi:hypothetical protein